MAKKTRRSKKETVRIEKGSIVKRNKGLIKTALVYPNTYQAGMSSLGFQTVYGLINDLDHVAAERVFLPKDKEGLQSIETGLDLSQFDIIFFSISFENDYLNLVSMLKRAGIPLRSTDRGDSYPLVIAGGVACFLNPEPIAPFMDIMLLGEGELLIEPFFDIYTPDLPREDLYQELVPSLAGVYVPGDYIPQYNPDKDLIGMKVLNDQAPGQIRVRRVRELGDISTTTRILSSDTAFKNIFLVETGRGCHHGCRFCSAGFIYRPPRFYPEDVVIRALGEAKELTNKVGLVSAAVSDHPGINTICARGIEEELHLSFSSLRADALTDELITTLQRSGVKTATIAPEAGSERMRRIINKKISEADLLSATQRLVETGIINLKLYFMIGLPFESDDDILAIVDLTQKIRERFLETSRKKQKIGTITLSINPFIPKPATPFQWAPMERIPSLKKKLKMITDGLKRVPNMQINSESFRMARINALLSRGDRQIADILESAVELGWSRALKEAKDYCEVQIHTERQKDAFFPWDIVDTGIKRPFLRKEYDRAKAEKISPDCPMIDCNRCGICRSSS
ncbi:MAG: radical SAM protein [Desulfobacterium sp.]|nr:radical SAM protein [Desulfobacterium sp.]